MDENMETTCYLCGGTPAEHVGWAGHLCNDCYDDLYSEHCDDCGDALAHNDIYHAPNGCTYCESCYDDNVTTCDDCGRDIMYDDSYDDGWNRLCERCYDNSHGTIREYHSQDKTARFFPMSGAPYYIGAELEAENIRCRYNNDDIAEAMRACFPEGAYLFFETDGSLSDGFETISAPMTLDYFESVTDAWARALREAARMGMRSHNTSTCGLHVHIGREAFGDSSIERDLTIAKVLYLSSVFEDDLQKLARRVSSSWCKPHPKVYSVQAADDYAKNDGRYDRYRMWNLTNRDTIEYRAARGTLAPRTFVASVYLPVLLVLAARRIDVADIQDIGSIREWLSWSSVPVPEALSDYLTEKGM